MCGTCVHPGGQHYRTEAQGCALCPCPAWKENGVGYWSDDQQDKAERARDAADELSRLGEEIQGDS
jgi:hypothetical protein